MRTILIVDDSREIRSLVKATLGVEDYTVLEAPNGKRGIEIARREKPAVVIMDLHMPGRISGMEATRTIKSDPELARCHIIILTGNDDGQVRKLGLQAGASDFFIKPFSPLKLVEKIEKLFGSPPSGAKNSGN